MKNTLLIFFLILSNPVSLFSQDKISDSIFFFIEEKSIVLKSDRNEFMSVYMADDFFTNTIYLYSEEEKNTFINEIVSSDTIFIDNFGIPDHDKQFRIINNTLDSLIRNERVNIYLESSKKIKLNVINRQVKYNLRSKIKNKKPKRGPYSIIVFYYFDKKLNFQLCIGSMPGPPNF
jgi:hypothetical protein